MAITILKVILVLLYAAKACWQGGANHRNHAGQACRAYDHRHHRSGATCLRQRDIGKNAHRNYHRQSGQRGVSGRRSPQPAFLFRVEA